MAQQACNEPPAGLGELQFVIGIVEGVCVSFEQGHAGVHAGPVPVVEGARHERGVNASLRGNFLDHEAVGDDGVAHGQRVHVANVDLLLTAGHLVMAVFYRYADVLERQDSLTPEI